MQNSAAIAKYRLLKITQRDRIAAGYYRQTEFYSRVAELYRNSRREYRREDLAPHPNPWARGG